MGSVLGLVIFIMRFWIPESPPWLVIHGRPAEAQPSTSIPSARISAMIAISEPSGTPFSMPLARRNASTHFEKFGHELSLGMVARGII
jgi:hypothetical protein